MALDFINYMKAALRKMRSYWPTSTLDQTASRSLPTPVDSASRPRSGAWLSAPMLYVVVTIISAVLSILGSRFWGLIGLAGLVVWPALAVLHFEMSGATWAEWSARLRKALGARVGDSPGRD